MATVRFTIQTDLPPEAVLAAATDFTERRPAIWSRIDPARYQVHAVGDTWADATEGSREMGGMWARERYDWSRPGVVRAEVQDSDVFRPGSAWELRAEPRPGGGSLVHWEATRRGTGKGRVITAMMRLAGPRMFSGYLREVLEGWGARRASA
jgi:hypothetical protein